MDIKIFIKKYQLILILSAIVVILIIIKNVYGYKGGAEEIQQKIITPTPTIIETRPTPTENLEVTLDINPDFPLQLLLPETTKDYIIPDYYAPMILKVIPLISDKTKIEQEIKAWIKENGLDPESHKLVWGIKDSSAN